jgi:hypothetical protein
MSELQTRYEEGDQFFYEGTFYTVMGTRTKGGEPEYRLHKKGKPKWVSALLIDRGARDYESFQTE